MADKTQALEFVVGVRDKASRKLAALQASISRTSELASNMGVQVAGSFAAMAGVGMSMAALVSPAIDFNRALGEVASLGVDGAALDTLGAAANQFAMDYGGSAADVIRASYDIQSAIAGLDGAELSSFTVSSGVLAKATKADVGTITSYMGTMYGIFQQQADKMGKAEWVEQLAGRTAFAVQMFKTNGDEMAAAFGSLGANATAAGIDAAEQMAILGSLQATMSGSEAGTKYNAFLSGVGGAQKELGLSFTDADGNMLGIIPILEKIRGKFGDTLDVAESDALKKAFGSDEAVSMLKLLMANTDGLADNIQKIGEIDGMEHAEKMAASMTDVWAKLGGTLGVANNTLGQMLLPTLERLVDPIVHGVAAVTAWTAEHEELSQTIGAGIVYFLGAASAIALLAMATNISKFLWLTSVGPLKGMVAAMKWLANVTKIQTAMTWLFNSALWANPVTWVVAGIIALIVAVGALIYWWDDLVAAFTDMSWLDAVLDGFKSFLSPLEFLGDTWDNLMGKIGFGDDEAKIETSQTIPGMTNVATAPPVPESIRSSGRTDSVPRGGLMREVNNNMSKNNSSNTYIETVNVNAGDKDPKTLQEEMHMGVS